MQNKVVFINRFFYPDHSATSQMLSELVFGLVRDGYDVHVVTSRVRYEKNKDILPAYEEIQGARIHRVWSTNFGRANLIGRAGDYLSFYMALLLKLLIIANQNDVLVAKTDPPLLSVLVRFVSLFKKCRQINWIQDLFPEVAKALNVPLVKGWFYSCLVKLRNNSLLESVSNVVIGQGMANKLLSEGVPQDKITVIPNWSNDKSVFPVARSENELRKNWGYETELLVGYSGNLGRGHDFEAIIHSMRNLKSENDIAFLFIGEGAKKEELMQVVEEEGLRATFKPYQPASILAQSLSVPDVHFITLIPDLEGYIVPSKFYGILASGRACIFIGANDGELAKIILEHDLGRVCESGNPGKLLKILKEFKADPDLSTRLGGNAKNLFDREYSFRRALERWKVVLSYTNKPLAV